MKKERLHFGKDRLFKKLTVFIIAILMLFSLFGCDNGEKNGSGTSSKSSEQTESREDIPSVSSEPQSELNESEIAETAEAKEFVFEDVVLTLLGHFDITVEPNAGFAQYTDPYFGILNVGFSANGKVGQNPPQGEFVNEVTNEEIGVIAVYKSNEGYAAEFAVGSDVYSLEFKVNADRGIQVEDADFWFINTLTQLKLTQNGRHQALGLGDGESEALQAFYMSTFESLTGTTPYEFTASDPQPYTVYLIIAGDGFTQNHKLIGFDEVTETEYSEQYSDSMNTLETMLNDDSHTLIYTSDPNRASMILISERKYKKSSKEYNSLTAYSCEYTLTAIDTATRKSKSFNAVTYPDTVLRDVPFGTRNYYCSVTYDLYDYKDFLKSVIGWLE